MLVYKINGQNIQILNKTVVIAITLHVYVLIARDERRLSLHTNQLVSIVIIIINYWTKSSKISRFVGGEQINYSPNAEANNWSASHRQMVIFARSRPIIVLLFTYKASLYLSLKLRHCINFKVDVHNELYTQTLFHKKITCSSSSLIFLACKYCRKTLTAVLVAFFYSLSVFPLVNKTTRLLIVQENEPPLFTKSESNAHAQTIICSWATFLTNVHAQTIICTQLFAGKLTNQNWEYYKVNNNTKGWQLNQTFPTHTSKQSKNTRNIFTTALK